ncbi:sensor domain-containing diguanylate cyclase [Clostridium sp. DL1XJH146]
MEITNLKNRVDNLLIKIEEIRFCEIDKCIEYCNEALSLSKEIDYTYGIGKCNLYHGYALIFTGNYQEGIDHITKSVYIFKNSNDQKNLINCYNTLAKALLLTSDFEDSIEYFEEVLKISKKNSCENMIPIALNCIGDIFSNLNNIDEAISYYKQSYEIISKNIWGICKGIPLINLGYCSYLKNNYDQAYFYTIEGIKYLTKNKYYTYYSKAFSILALISWKSHKIDKAEIYFKRALFLAKRYKVYPSEIFALENYSQFLEQNNKIDKSIETLILALELSKKNNLFNKMSRFCSHLSDIYNKKGDSNKSYYYLKLYRDYNEKYEEEIIIKRANSLRTKKILAETLLEKETLQSTLSNVSIINELGKKITSTLDLDKIVELLINTIKKFMSANTFGIGFYDNDNKLINYSHFIEDGIKIKLPTKSLHDKNSLGAFCLRNKEMVIINNFSEDNKKYIHNAAKSSYYGRNNTINSIIYAPLIVNNDLIGIITVQSHKKAAFTKSNIEVINTLVPYASIALNNSIKSKELKKEIKIREDAENKLLLANKALDYLSKYDCLTNIPNRRNFDNLLRVHCFNHMEYKEMISLILIDIDAFKEYNDNYGHIEGDICIQTVAQTLNNSLINNYSAARYGGDEFAIILPNTDGQQAYDFGENLRQKIEKLQIVHGYSKVANYVTITLGVASIIPDNNFNICDFIKKADEALYTAKKRGRNRISLYSK